MSMVTSSSSPAAKVLSNVKTSKVKKIKNEDLVDDTKKTKKGAATKDNEKVKKEKKVYELLGQKHDPPQERNPLRIFYESLYEQLLQQNGFVLCPKKTLKERVRT
ncbi:hypothetical protein ABZP36_010176 [Zizania latifolia]